MLLKHNSPNRSGRLKKIRNEAIGQGCTWDGYTFQTRPNDVSLIAGRATKITAMRSLGETVPDFYWRSADNRMKLFTADEFLRFAIAVDEFVEQQYINSWAT